jgi:tRNA modification GTPase
VVDEVIVARLEPEGDGAGEERFEVNCHGGIVAVRAVLTCLEEAGAMVVDARELASRRAAAARPLSPAAVRQRALAELPRARTQLTAAMLLHQAAGALERALQEIERALAAGERERAEKGLDALLRTASIGRALLTPPKVALLGPPNVGKSTLFNALLEEERVIVHHEPGTTRDVVAETVSLRGVPFELIDTAGIRATEDELEQVAVQRASALAETCDVALLLFDAPEGREAAVALLPAVRREARVLLVGNKTDLLPAGSTPSGTGQAVYISARNKTGLDLLESALLEPYTNLIEDCRRGGAVAFEEAIEKAIRQVRERLRAGGPAEALAALSDLSEPHYGCSTGP